MFASAQEISGPNGRTTARGYYADRSLNSGVARTFHELLPGSELFLIPGAQHFVQLDEPEQVAKLILAMPRAGGEQV